MFVYFSLHYNISFESYIPPQVGFPQCVWHCLFTMSMHYFVKMQRLRRKLFFFFFIILHEIFPKGLTSLRSHFHIGSAYLILPKGELINWKFTCKETTHGQKKLLNLMTVVIFQISIKFAANFISGTGKYICV